MRIKPRARGVFAGPTELASHADEHSTTSEPVGLGLLGARHRQSNSLGQASDPQAVVGAAGTVSAWVCLPAVMVVT